METICNNKKKPETYIDNNKHKQQQQQHQKDTKSSCNCNTLFIRSFEL